MVKLMDVKGIPIVCLKDESRAGFLMEPVYDESNCIVGFLVDQLGLSFGRKFIALEDCLRIDKNNCIIYSSSAIRKLPRKRKYKRNNDMEKLLGRNVVTRDGKGLGVVRDLVFDIETGSIEGFELSRGFMEDVVQGRNLLLLRDGVEFAEDHIIAGRSDWDEKN